MNNCHRLINAFILVLLSSGVFASVNIIKKTSCPKDIQYSGNIYSPAIIKLIEHLGNNLGLFSFYNRSNLYLKLKVSGIQDGYHRHSMFLGYLFMDLNAQDSGWQKTGVYEEEIEEPSNSDKYESFKAYEYITIPPGEAIKFISIVWPQNYMDQAKGKYALRLYFNLDSQEPNKQYLSISEPYCL